METGLVLFLFVLNFAISWFNAWSVGKSWLESKAAGGFTHFVTWCGAVMSACGFTWCYSIVMALAATHVPYHGHMLLTPKYAAGVMELAYLAIILPIIGSGIGITISSWQNFARRRTVGGGALAGYNTFADIYNIYEASRAVPMIFKDLGGLFKAGDDDSKLKWVILLAAVALLGGIGTTFYIITSSARAKAYQVQYELNAGENTQASKSGRSH